jgi:hypothetical protein
MEKILIYSFIIGIIVGIIFYILKKKFTKVEIIKTYDSPQGLMIKERYGGEGLIPVRHCLYFVVGEDEIIPVPVDYRNNGFPHHINVKVESFFCWKKQYYEYCWVSNADAFDKSY